VVVQEAIRAVQERRFSLRVVASRYGMTHNSTITKFKKIKNGDKCNQPSVFASRYKSQHVFNENQELMLVDYIIKCSKLNYGMTHKPVCKLAYDNGWIVNFQ
jgi:hypothetical protein